MSRTATATPDAPPTDVWVRMLATVEPTAADRTRYHAGSVWCMSAARAAALIDAGAAERTSPPAAATRRVTEPLEPPSAADAPTPPAAAKLAVVAPAEE